MIHPIPDGPYNDLRFPGAPLLRTPRQMNLVHSLEPAQAAGSFRQRVIDYVESRYMDELSLRDVATALGYSPSHLTYRFRRETGVPITAWIIRRRIRAAASLLSDSALPVRLVCEAVGFHDLCYFTRQFVRFVGVTPGRFRRMNAGIAAASCGAIRDE